MSIRRNKKDYIAPYEMADPWEEVLLGDKELFKEMTEPHVPALVEAARGSIKQEKAKGNLLDKLLPEELVGETLLHAWARRFNKLERQSLKDWLLCVQRWALYQIVLKEKEWKRLTAVSLEAPVKPKPVDKQEDDWDRILPQVSVRECWRDVIPDENSLSHAV